MWILKNSYNKVKINTNGCLSSGFLFSAGAVRFLTSGTTASSLPDSFYEKLALYSSWCLSHHWLVCRPCSCWHVLFQSFFKDPSSVQGSAPKVVQNWECTFRGCVIRRWTFWGFSFGESICWESRCRKSQRAILSFWPWYFFSWWCSGWCHARWTMSCFRLTFFDWL